MMWFNQKPRYEHDCKTCEFFGQYENYDLWAHINKETMTLESVIARESSEPSDYASGNSFIACHKALLECYKRVYFKYGDWGLKMKDDPMRILSMINADLLSE